MRTHKLPMCQVSLSSAWEAVITVETCGEVRSHHKSNVQLPAMHSCIRLQLLENRLCTEWAEPDVLLNLQQLRLYFNELTGSLDALGPGTPTMCKSARSA